MNRFFSNSDKTMKLPVGGGGMDHRMLYVKCGHKGQRTGGTFWGNTPKQCPACNAKEKQ